MDSDFAVGLASKSMPALQQFGPQVPVVVNLTVEDEPYALILVWHRVPTPRREVDDAESAVAKRDGSVSPLSPIVRTPMANQLSHPENVLRSYWFSGQVVEAGDPAHSMFPRINVPLFPACVVLLRATRSPASCLPRPAS